MSEYPSYLIHYGTEGQKWHVRRYQNEDGTYTEEGLRRRREQYGISEKDNKKFFKDLSKLKGSKYNTGDGSYNFDKSTKRSQYYRQIMKNNVIKSASDNKKLYDSYSKMRNTEIKNYPPDWDEILWKHQKNKDWNSMSESEKEETYKKVDKEYDNEFKKYKEKEKTDPHTIAFKEYEEERKKIAEAICGKHSNTKLGDITYNEHVNTIISFALSDKYDNAKKYGELNNKGKMALIYAKTNRNKPLLNKIDKGGHK